MKICTTLGIQIRHMHAKTTKRLVKNQRKIRSTSLENLSYIYWKV